MRHPLRVALALVLSAALFVPPAASGSEAATTDPLPGAPPTVITADDFSVSWPDGWSVVATNPAVRPVLDGIGGEDIPVLMRASAGSGAEGCEIIDLATVKAALAPFGVDDTETLQFVAVEARHGKTRARAWSADGGVLGLSGYLEGVDADEMPFALYSFMGRDSWTGLEDAWLGLDCWAATDEHADWRDIAETFAFDPRPEVLASTGPFVVGGRIEVPAAGVALELPSGWYGADVSSEELISTMESLGAPVAYMAEQLDGSLRDYFEAVESSGSEVLIWAWEPDGVFSWDRSCELILHERRATTARALVRAGNRDAAERSASSPESEWTLVELPAGEAARHDYAFESGSTGSEYFLIGDDAMVELDCGRWQSGQAADSSVRRETYSEIAESLEIPSSPPPAVIA